MKFQNGCHDCPEAKELGFLVYVAWTFGFAKTQARFQLSSAKMDGPIQVYFRGIEDNLASVFPRIKTDFYYQLE